jgi:hypothetical protein
VESQIKTMKHYATDSNANKKSSEVELEEWIDGDYENQVSSQFLLCCSGIIIVHLSRW